MVVQVKRVYIFTVIVLACGWIGKIIDTLLIKQPEGQSLGLLLWLIAPMITAVLCASFSKYKTLGLRPYWKGQLRWFLLSLLFYPVCMTILLGFGALTGWADDSNFDASKFILSFLSFFLFNFFRSILEEVAWRGFLTERLIKLRINDWLVYLIVTLIWSSWHIPYYLFYIASEHRLSLIASGYIVLLTWSVLYTELYRISRSIWTCVLLHAGANAVQYIMFEKYVVLQTKWAILISPSNGILIGILCILAGLYVRRARRKRENNIE